MISMSTLARYPSLAGRGVLVTGGATGIGETLVEQFVAQGAKVGFIDIDAASGDALAERLGRGAAAPPQFVAADLTDVPTLEAAIAEVRQRVGPLTVLLNNAANDLRHAIDSVTSASWDAAVAVNLKHQFFAARAVADDMRAAGGGSIVNLGSVSWKRRQGGMPVYLACKAAVHGLTRALAREACLAGPLLPLHIASMALFLAADDSAMCTAQEFVVDGGWT